MPCPFNLGGPRRARGLVRLFFRLGLPELSEPQGEQLFFVGQGERVAAAFHALQPVAAVHDHQAHAARVGMALLLVDDVAYALGAELAAELVETGGHDVRFSQLVAAADDFLEALPPVHHFDDEPATVRVALELVDDVALLQAHGEAVYRTLGRRGKPRLPLSPWRERGG